MRRVQPGTFAAAVVAAAVFALTIGTGAAPPPTITRVPMGNVGDPSHDYSFHASAVDLKARGYVEEELFIEGRASRFNTPAQATGSVIDSDHPYKTRIAVRRPAAAARFNGTVIVEWNNVTAGRDLDIDWFQTYDYLMRTGYAWVGVTAQRVGVEAVKVWNPRRYGSLDVTHGGTLNGDELSYDIFTQVAQAIRTPGAVNVLGGLPVERMFATGHSQSAGRLATYVNSVHPLSPVFDAVVLHGGGGRVRADLGKVKVWKLLAETDILNQAANRQPDTDSYRSWEVAGTSHVDFPFVTYSRMLSQRDGSPSAPGSTAGGGRAGAGTARAGDGGGRGAQPAATGAARGDAAMAAPAGNCDRPSYSRVPFYQVMNAAFDHLNRWVTNGTAPPSAPPIEMTSVGPPGVVARDGAGNGLGGIRLSQHAVPTAVNTGQNSGPGFCRLNGSHEPFDAGKIASLYPTHSGYVNAVKDVTARNVKAGYILQFDADQTVAEADKSGIGAR